MIPFDIVQQSADYVTRIFEQANTKDLHFHSLEHTQRVVEHALEIGQKEKVTPEELAMLQVAAWFHDVGHLSGGIQDHEQRSIDVAKHFFEERGIDDAAFIQRVNDIIMATRLPHVPGDKLGEIICDADVYHFGTPDFRKTNKRVRKELKARAYPALITDWPRRSLRLLQSQHFFSPSVRQKLEEGKAENIRWLKKKVEEAGDGIPEDDDPGVTAALAEGAISPEAVVKEEKQTQKTNQGLVARGMQTMLRLTSSNHLDLSRMADTKANILISVNSIIISIILSIFIDRLDTDPFLTIPTILFLISSVVTVIIAILATRPKLTEGTFTKENIHRKQTNLIFFGNFYKSSLDEYMWAMNEMMNYKEYLYETLVKDIYFLGKVLGRKYKLIRLAYNIFMIGLIVAVISFSIAIALNTPSGHATVINANGAPL